MESSAHLYAIVRNRPMLTDISTQQRALPHEEVLRLHDRPGPRYTSYPTADRFVEAFDAQEWTRALQWRGQQPTGHGQPLSVYVHIPFCESLCYYCACNKIITRKRERAQEYLDDLEREMALVNATLGIQALVTQLHLGGGTPTYLDDEGLAHLCKLLERYFSISPDAERAIEVDPRTVDELRLECLARLGFNRLSFGVQDFDLHVQQAVHRIQPFHLVRELMQSARSTGFDSINVDLIYGLPLQTRTTLMRTIEQTIELSPDRIALYGYAHLPSRFKPQRRIHDSQLPAANEKLAMLATSIEQLTRAGYVYIGMDHFAKPDDPLAIAHRRAGLHRNFQGYTTQGHTDLIGLGVSAISRVGTCYSQNTKSIDDYQQCVRAGELPVERGLAMSRDDVLRHAVIMAIMCHGHVDFESVESSHLIDFETYFSTELAHLRDLQKQGLVTLGERCLDVTAQGWYVVRTVASVFDRYLQADRSRQQYSRII
jgi:oxygen-independent coproporphyrinogen III oxidase